MIKVAYKSDDLRYIFLYSDTKGEIEGKNGLEHYLNKIPDYMFLPSFTGIKRQEVFLHKVNKGGKTFYYAHAGLWKNIYDWCKSNNIQIDGIDDYFKYRDFQLNIGEFEKIVDSWNLTPTPREYQVEAAWKILKYRMSLSQLATRAGKTLIAYIIFRYMKEYCSANKILMIVPNISLVKQGVADMNEYGQYFTQEAVWAKGEYCEGANLTIGTFQSLVNRLDKKSKRYNPKFFDDFDVVCVDEAHTATCKSIDLILNQPFIKNAKLKFGFSGSLPVANTIDSFCVQSLIGPVMQDIRTKELQDAGYIADAEVHQIRIHYTDAETLQDYIKCGEYLCSTYVDTINDKKEKVHQLLPKDEREFTIQHIKKLPIVLQQTKKLYDDYEYRDYLIDLCKADGANLLNLEQMLVHRSKKRLDVIEQLLSKMNKNCLVFAHNTEYLNYLEKCFKEKFPDRHIYKITGNTNEKKRSEIIDALLKSNNNILFASYKCVGTGLTLKNIDYGIFAQSFKSQVINKQSLGRGLCLANDKEKYVLYDIIDCFPTERILYQGKAKVKLFQQEDIKIDVKDI